MAEAAVHEEARAKLNLDLLVTGRRADGYHELDSLVVFAELADKVRVELAPSLDIVVDGPFADAIGPATGNIALRAAGLLQRHAGARQGARIALTKNIPVAAGLGGGSADAAATLRALRSLWGLSVDLPAMQELALRTGADVPVCLGSQPARMRGIGERLEPFGLPDPLHLLLVNPGVPVATGDVFRGLDGRVSGPRSERPDAFRDTQDLVCHLRQNRNDLEGPARRLVPEVEAAIGAIESRGGCLLARMSGSGATCFGIFAAAEAAQAAARAIAAAHPGWWVVPGRA